MGARLSRLWTSVLGRFCLQTLSYDDQLDSNSIRLLSLVRPRWFSFGLCSPQLVMSKHSMDDLPKYLALSYTWGPPQDEAGAGKYGQTLPIRVNDSSFPVLRNLFEALHGLQRRWNFKDDIQHLWIDAICINQHDLDERAAQVAIMDQVYKRSSTTAIWLGTAGPEADATMQVFDAIRRIPSEEFAPYYRQHPNGAAPPAAFWLKHGLPGFDDEETWRPVVRFFEHRWFNRAWIIQEATLSSNNMYLFWGRHAMTWDDVGHVAFAGQVARLGIMTSQPALARYLAGDPAAGQVCDWVVRDPLVNSFQLWYNRHRYLQRSLTLHDDTMLREMRALTGCDGAGAASWLMYFALSNRWADASDARDKVFCHLGMVNNIASQDGLALSSVQPDYSAAVDAAQLYKRLMTELVQETNSLAIFMAVSDPPSARLAGLPTWVPDLSRRHGLDLMWSIRPQFNACQANGENTGSRKTSRVVVSGESLHVKAMMIGSVTTLSASLPDFLGPSWHSWAGQLLALDPVYRYTGESRVEAFWRTALMNSVARTFPAQWPGVSSAGDMFRAYVLQSMTRYYPGAEADSATREKYRHSLCDVNDLAAADHSGQIPSFNGLSDLTAQIAGVGEEELLTLPDSAVLEALGASVDKASGFLIGMDGSMVNRRIVMTGEGHIANAPMWTEVGDAIAVLDGCPCPVVLRPARASNTCTDTDRNGEPQSPSYWSLVGPAYVHGAMYGELVRAGLAWRELTIR
ncbi:hypothetical protein JDV02_009727 [Purpureocillium takamizusanense]|uniref:Heterokaryon incompatibility domain-containing protein n=1 Tax=Purpureocillium takamizusanense TaxID=2060973 RepID=A0A9Q8QR87_9HYPO|nr:uncharacterized protein JDV02_009727 [Purpureocillium takamizusanense]UNI23937.1 hypothetical protein JDV02_009727 [Purpureocillium takamizusanense]